MSTKIKTGFTPKKALTAIAVSAALTIAAPAAIAADAFNGVVKGVIVDGQNEATAGATITLTHKSKNITRTITTNEKGEYTLRKLPVGEYKVTIAKPGYDTVEEGSLQVTLGSSIVFNGQLIAEGSDVERISVIGSQIARVDMESSTGGIVVTAADLDRLPVESGFDAIALLAPGVNSNSTFGTASIGGGSSAENAYYLNGINITYIKTGIGSINLPWEAVAQTEVMTGGIAPEFGGALGGIVNAVSKSGSNEFEFGAYGRIDPEATRSHHDNLLTNEGEYFSNSEQDENTFTRLSIWASGAIIEDKLFFYAMYAPQKNKYDAAGRYTIDIGENVSDRYLGTLDWYITDNHSITATAIGFTNKGEGKTYDNDWETQQVGDELSEFKSRTGGDIFGLTYSGVLTDDISIEVVAGRTTDKTYNSVTSSDPLVWSQILGNGWEKISQETASSITESEFIRDQLRADLSWMIGDHDLKIGFDYTNIQVDYQNKPNGVGDRAGWWDVWNGYDGSPTGNSDPFIRQRIRTDFTDSEVNSLAFYVQDTWTVTDQLVLNLGLRYSNVYNTVSDGRKYVDVKGQIAPRVQAIYDLTGDGTSKVYATYGRYFQPVSANMNITQGGARRDVRRYYELGQLDATGQVVLDADGAPNTGAFITEDVVQEGISEPSLIASQDMESMYSDEFTIGYQAEFLDGELVYGIRGIYRDLKRSIEDTDYAPVIRKYFDENGMTGAPSYAYILNNPGSDLDISYDFDGDGTVERVFIPADYIQLPPPERKYGAIENTLAGNVGDTFYYSASYTWSHSWGNTEGLVRTDNGQADPGWTTSYDYAELMDNSNGNLPNDRRHSIKFNGSYYFTEAFSVGFNARITSGAPISKFARHPYGVDSCAAGSPWEECNGAYYDHVSFYDASGNPAPRGYFGTTDWIKDLDLSAMYETDLAGGNLMLKATVYNVFNFDTQTTVQNTHARDGANGIEVNPNWGMTTGRLGARYVSFEARYSF
ncbi:TonB-dependent receptor [Thalassotalea agarivorans]|uniref:TonB-dependent Receptor Plug Domain n=1 Tax=Thalassotalea agarivorans TaxID=349064 RepID=A0A1I0FWV9_THASX|nr:TonB-dependent receptor [Thalassotalea agarivorans]SET62065.1 TonB-dependent Receptor Plug Domain [Thalassotalea agarivorans]